MALLDRYDRGITLFADAVRKTPEPFVSLEPAPGKWSVLQITCHIADSEAVAAVRYRMIAAQPGSVLTAFDQEKWESNLQYAHQSLDEALEGFRAMRRHNMNMLRVLPFEAWSRTAVHEERGEHTLYRMVEHNATHLENHAGQVIEAHRRLAAKPL